MEVGRYCSEVFLDVLQAFDKIWHWGLLYKIKTRFLTDFYVIIRSTATATYANDTAIVHNNHIEASSRLQESLHHIQRWFKQNQYSCDSTVQYSDIYYSKRDVSISNTEWSENPTSRRCQIFRTTPGSQAKLEKNIYILNANNLDYNWGKCTGYSVVSHNCRLKINSYCTMQYSNLYGPMV